MHSPPIKERERGREREREREGEREGGREREREGGRGRRVNQHESLQTLHVANTLFISINLQAVASCLYVSINLINVLIKNYQLHSDINSKVNTVSLSARYEIFDEFRQVFHDDRLVALH